MCYNQHPYRAQLGKKKVGQGTKTRRKVSLRHFLLFFSYVEARRSNNYQEGSYFNQKKATSSKSRIFVQNSTSHSAVQTHCKVDQSHQIWHSSHGGFLIIFFFSKLTAKISSPQSFRLAYILPTDSQKYIWFCFALSEIQKERRLIIKTGTKPQTCISYSLISICSVICLKQSEVRSASICFMENHSQLQRLQIKIDIQISNLHSECGEKEN